MGGQQAQFAHARLQRMGAFDMVDRRGEAHHLLDPTAGIGSGEVLTHPPPQIGRRADIEHFRARSAEEIHPGPMRNSLGQHSFSALGIGDRGEIRAQILVGRHALVAHPLDQRVQDVDGRARIIECPVSGLGGGPEQSGQCRKPNAGRFLAAEDPARQPHRAQHRGTGPRDIALFGRGPEKADIESRVMRHQHGPVGEFQEHRQHGRDGRGIAHHRGGDPGEFDDLRRDSALRVHQGGELTDDLSAAHLDRPDLGDRVR